MTSPEPMPEMLGWPENSVIFCVSCEEYYATSSQPLCPSCLEDKVKEIKG